MPLKRGLAACGREERKWPRGSLLQVAAAVHVDVAPASLVLWPTARIYIRGASLGHAGLGRTAHPLGRGLAIVPLVRTFPNAAIRNSQGATQLRLVAPMASALVHVHV